MDQLYSFRECYFETHGVEDAGRKQQDVREAMEKTLQQMEEVVGMSGKEHATPCPSLKCDRVLLSLCEVFGILFVAAAGWYNRVFLLRAPV